MVLRHQSKKGTARGGKLRVALYTRVSTPEQAKHELSVTDQLKQLRAACAERGWEVVAEFTDAASAWKGKRPGYDEMISQATSEARPFDIVFVHSLSRYSRKMLASEQGFATLEAVGVKVTSLTEMIDGDEGWLARSIIAMFSEQSSRETSKHVTRVRRENALQGYYNGGIPPVGYKSEADDETRGDRVRKRLVEDLEWSPIVRLIFKLHREGDGEGHPLGSIGIASWLNKEGYRTRSEGLWHTSAVHKILTNEAYVGRAYMNRVARRTGLERPIEEWVYSPTPPLISEEDFQETQIRLEERRPKRQAPRITTSDVLLGGIIRCGGCGGAMSAATGTGSKGKVYNYYACHRRVTSGITACEAPQRVCREDMDDIVLDAVGRRLLTSDRVQELTGAVVRRRLEGEGDAQKDLAGSKATLVAIDKKLNRLVDAVLSGTLMESETIRRKQADLESQKALTEAVIKLRTAKMRQAMKPLDLVEAGQRAEVLRLRLLEASPQIKRRYIRALVGQVEVAAGEITIRGTNDAVAEAAAAANDDNPPPVQSSVREWRTERDSNPR